MRVWYFFADLLLIASRSAMFVLYASQTRLDSKSAVLRTPFAQLFRDA